MDFTHPVASDIISSGYGWRKDPFTGKLSFHKGLDYKVKENTPVFPALPGKVILSANSPSYGNYIILEHSDDLKTLYAHLNKSIVKANQEVNQDDIIAYSGKSGRATGYHLHFEIYYKNNTIDPKKLLKLPPQNFSFIPLVLISGIIFLIYK